VIFGKKIPVKALSNWNWVTTVQKFPQNKNIVRKSEYKNAQENASE
jgi:hypothetical protein